MLILFLGTAVVNYLIFPRKWVFGKKIVMYTIIHSNRNKRRLNLCYFYILFIKLQKV